ncbi:MAG: hypothetical protein SGI74_14025 [Oligoflexia bacterium]|nr:hypothetical protein [Oligoflexia bacterium]
MQPSTNEQKRKLAQTLICPVLPCGISIPGDNELDTSSILECAVDEARRKSPDSGRRQ